jgi:hypothetical protein
MSRNTSGRNSPERDRRAVPRPAIVRFFPCRLPLIGSSYCRYISSSLLIEPLFSGFLFPALEWNGTGRRNRTYFNSGMRFSRSCDGSEARQSDQQIRERASEPKSHKPGNSHSCPFATRARTKPRVSHFVSEVRNRMNGCFHANFGNGTRADRHGSQRSDVSPFSNCGYLAR